LPLNLGYRKAPEQAFNHTIKNGFGIMPTRIYYSVSHELLAKEKLSSNRLKNNNFITDQGEF
jgi:hypothetical protein